MNKVIFLLIAILLQGCVTTQKKFSQKNEELVKLQIESSMKHDKLLFEKNSLQLKFNELDLEKKALQKQILKIEESLVKVPHVATSEDLKSLREKILELESQNRALKQELEKKQRRRSDITTLYEVMIDNLKEEISLGYVILSETGRISIAVTP